MIGVRETLFSVYSDNATRVGDRFQKTQDGQKKRRFTAPIRADQSYELALSDFEVHFLDHYFARTRYR